VATREETNPANPISSSENKALIVESDATLEPAGPWRCARNDEHMTDLIN
jgi:hypothetical protein